MRMRRIRNNPIMRSMVRETQISCSDLIYPLFVVEGEKIRREIPSLKGCYHLSIDMLEGEIKELIELKIPAVILFGIPDKKDSCGSSGFDKDGVVQRAVRKIRELTDKIVVITDVCMCEYTDHGHCGILDEHNNVDNDRTLEYLSKIAISHAEAGAHIVAPSDMMDLRVKRIREDLDARGFKEVSIMAYSAKYASNYYGPFREAADSAPSFGDRKTYQMDYHNINEAMKEIELDIDEGADFIIVKPALAYLDVLKEARQKFNTRFVAYSVSGEYAMIKNAVDAGLVKEDIIYESMICVKRAGADMIITYFAKYIAELLKNKK